MKYSDTTRDAWSQYWQKGFLTTFTLEKGENYSGAFKSFWHEQFSKLQDGATIADLAAGNGAILALALEFMLENNRKFELIAVDYAKIELQGELKKHQTLINVLSDTPLEDIKLNANTVDLCVSQFGFEYSDTTKSGEEVKRILKDTGTFAAIMHHKESLITTDSRQMIQQIDLCNQSELSKVVKALLSRLDKLKADGVNPALDTEAPVLRNKFNEIASNLLNQQSASQTHDHIRYYLGELSGVFSKRASDLTTQKKLRIVEDVEDESQLYAARMKAMIEAAQDEKSMRQLSKMFLDLNFDSADFKQIENDGQAAAWSFIASDLAN